jgi:hypothetical protein
LIINYYFSFDGFRSRLLRLQLKMFDADDCAMRLERYTHFGKLKNSMAPFLLV